MKQFSLPRGPLTDYLALVTLEIELIKPLMEAYSMKTVKISALITALFLGIQPATHAMELLIPSAALTAMTLNVRRKGKEAKPERLWDNRKQALFDLIKQHQPDLIGLQEPIQEQRDEIVAGISDETNAYQAIGEGRGACWWGMGKDEQNPIVYNPAKVTLVESGTFSLNNFHHVGLFTWLWNLRTIGLLPRICTWAAFTTADGKKIYTYNAHLDHKFVQARAAQVAKILEHISTHVTDKSPVILMGDFNQQWNTLKNLAPSFINTREQAPDVQGPEATRTTVGGKKETCIDHVLLKPGADIQATKHTTIDSATYVSDHRPVKVEIALP